MRKRKRLDKSMLWYTVRFELQLMHPEAVRILEVKLGMYILDVVPGLHSLTQVRELFIMMNEQIKGGLYGQK